jgi:photosynthetic reaction center cytochrome c subunit
MRFLVTMLLVLVPLCAQDTPPARPQGRGGAPKNLKILKPEDVNRNMRNFTQSLGVRCDFCHVPPDMSSDDKPQKVTARTMLTMVHDINTKLGATDEKQVVTCYTCHRGKNMPDTAPPANPGQ